MGIIIRKEVWRIQYSQGTLNVSNHKKRTDDNTGIKKCDQRRKVRRKIKDEMVETIIAYILKESGR